MTPLWQARRGRARSGRPSSHALALVPAAAFAAFACVHVPPRSRASVRRTEYFETHREVAPAVAEAIERGHVILGMDREQVTVVLGQPIKRTVHGFGPEVEIWLYPAVRFHQDQMRSHGVSLFRLVFLDGRLRLIEPI